MVQRIWLPVGRLVRRIRVFLGRHEIWYYLITWAACVVLGRTIMVASPVKVVAAVVGLGAMAFVTRHIDLGIVAVMLLSASFMHPGAIAHPITIGGQGFHASELLIITMLITVLVRSLADKRFEFFKSPITLPLLALCGAVLMSIVVSYVNHLADPRGGSWAYRVAYNTTRPMFSYLLFFPVAFGLRDRMQLNRVLRLTMWITAGVSVLVVIQYFIAPSGKSVFLGGQIADFTTALTDDANIARTTPPGSALMLALFLLAVANVAYRGWRESPVQVLTASVLGIGLLFSFYRVFWFSSFLGIVIIWLASNKVVKRRLPVMAIIALMLAVIGSILVTKAVPSSSGRNFSRALANRFVSIFKSETYLIDESFQNRVRENKHAIQQIKKSPIFGIGADSPRQWGQWTRPGVYTKIRYPIYYIHNSYLELWMIYGLPGIVSFLWLSIAFLVRSFLLFRRTRDPSTKAMAIAFFAAYVGFMQRSLTQMHIVQDHYHMMTVALMWGVIEVLWRLELAEKACAREETADEIVPVSTETGSLRRWSRTPVWTGSRR